MRPLHADRSLPRSEGGFLIGLCLVRGLVELHGGRVEAFSDGPGCGSEFVVSPPLPSAEEGACSRSAGSAVLDAVRPQLQDRYREQTVRFSPRLARLPRRREPCGRPAPIALAGKSVYEIWLTRNYLSNNARFL